MQIEKIKLPSEEEGNPIAKIRFYKKPTGDNNQVVLLTKDEVQEMVCSNDITYVSWYHNSYNFIL